MFITSENQVKGMILASIMLTINIILNLILIPIISYIGASVALLVTESIGLLCGILLLNGVGYKLNIIETIKAPAAGIVVILLILALAVYFNFSLFAASIISFLLYVLITIKIGITKDDVALIREVIGDDLFC
jgi:O-antigen/teichoic acid export membrane protein